MRSSSLLHRGLTTFASLALANAHVTNMPTRLHMSSVARMASPSSKRVRMVATTPTESRWINDNVGNNVTPYISNLVGRGLHRDTSHPLGIIKAKIENYFNSQDGDVKFDVVDNLDPLVSAQACFDDLLIPEDHPGRKPSDTYYVTRDGGRAVSSAKDTLLRTHTSAHQSMLMREGREAFLCTGDVYRRDEIDATHFPAFHQMEGLKLFDPALVGGEMTREEWLASPGCQLIADDLKKTLEGLCDELFGPVEKRWIDEYFPFTEPSFELEIFYNGDWMEVRRPMGVLHARACTHARTCRRRVGMQHGTAPDRWAGGRSAACSGRERRGAAWHGNDAWCSMPPYGGGACGVQMLAAGMCGGWSQHCRRRLLTSAATAPTSAVARTARCLASRLWLLLRSLATHPPTHHPNPHPNPPIRSPTPTPRHAQVLGCGVIHSGVLANVEKTDRHGWAFGLGLERLAMVLFSIPDIRLFWTVDKRFTKQFKEGTITKFKPYSKFPPCYKARATPAGHSSTHTGDPPPPHPPSRAAAGSPP